MMTIVQKCSLQQDNYKLSESSTLIIRANITIEPNKKTSEILAGFSFLKY